ncbi:MAG: hypothetical protein J3K34DRAFT_416472 [Monoraphidium minutum]|nr:MAG: hypothetical protein J3K34DRAFT_416472 [Monoraphidium minutum]
MAALTGTNWAGATATRPAGLRSPAGAAGAGRGEGGRSRSQLTATPSVRRLHGRERPLCARPAPRLNTDTPRPPPHQNRSAPMPALRRASAGASAGASPLRRGRTWPRDLPWQPNKASSCASVRCADCQPKRGSARARRSRMRVRSPWLTRSARA